MKKHFQLRSLVVLFLFLAAYFLVQAVRTNQDIRQRAHDPTPATSPIPEQPEMTSGQELIHEEVIPEPNQILEIILTYDGEKTPVLTITSASIKNGYVPDYIEPQTGYRLELLSDNSVAFETLFDIPYNEHIPEEKENPPPTEVVLTLPWRDNFQTAQVKDAQGNILSTKPLTNIREIHNQPQFFTLPEPTQETGEPQSWLDKLFSVQASAGNGFLDIAFIGDGFVTAQETERLLFDIQRTTAHLLTYEPFKSHAAKIRFHYVPNTSPLGCQISGTTISCTNTDSLVIQKVNSSAVPYDRIVVILNSPKFAASATTRTSGVVHVTNVFRLASSVVHELGHTIGLLRDEYITNNSNQTAELNCYDGTPPNPAWEGLVPVEEYFQGCNMPTWYRSKYMSIMVDSTNARYFNQVSVKYLNDKLNFYSSSTIPMPTYTAPAPTLSPRDFSKVLHIAPIGDSLAQGYTVTGSYRYYLQNKNPHFRFYGGMSDSTTFQPSQQGYQGRPDFTIQTMINLLTPSGYYPSVPDVFLLSIGITEIIDIDNVDPSSSADRMNTLINLLLSKGPNIHVFVTTLLPMNNNELNNRVINFNNSLKQLIANNQTVYGNRVHLVDIYPLIQASELPDGIHPSAAGYQKIADAFYASMLNVPGLVPSLPVGGFIPFPNANFESGNTNGWTRSDDILAADFFAVDCQQWGSCKEGRYYLKLSVKDDNVAPFDPHVATDFVATEITVSGKSFEISFDVKAHAGTKTLTGISLQRQPKNGTDWSQATVDIGSVTATPTWQRITKQVMFPQPTNGNTTGAIRVVLRAAADGTPIYFDNIQVKYLGDVAAKEGDVTGDGVVTIADYNQVAQSFTNYTIQIFNKIVRALVN